MDPVVSQSRERIVKGSKSFAAAAEIFLPKQRDAAYMLYAWCRHCDDEIDGQTLGHKDAAVKSGTPAQRLAVLREKTQGALDGRAEDTVFIGLQRVLRDHALSPAHPRDLLEGMAMDAEGRVYNTLEELLTYCYHVAGVVGLMMGRIMGVRERVTLERACDLGIAFQLTNIARDVVADAACGRVYLPLDWLAQEGLDPQTIALPANRAALMRVVSRLLLVAEVYYNSADAGIASLPFRCAFAVAAASRIYRRIGAVLISQGPAAWDSRAHVSASARLSNFALGGLQALRAAAMPQTLSPPRRAGLWTPSNVGVT